VCPTYYAVRMRRYGPRGRINLILNLMRGSNGVPSPDSMGRRVVDGTFTCLHCGACDTQCPAEIKISDVILSFKALVLSQRFKGRRSK